MAEIIEEKIRVGISACNAGAKVRYNRAGWDRLAPLGRERNGFIWTPVCPEVMAGLGVPRHPIRLVSGNGNDFWAGQAAIKNRQGMEVTEQCKEGSLACLDSVRRAEAEAFVFMEGSPTCGVYRTTLKNQRLGKPPGVFGSLLLEEELFLIPALDLESPLKWWDWRRRLHAFCWLKRKNIETKGDMYDAWHILKFLCQEVDEKRARELGHEIAELPKHTSREEIRSWKRETLFLLRKPSDIKRIETAMNKHYAYYRKHINPEAEEMVHPDREMAKYKFVAELLQMEKKAVLEDFLFAGTPVIYRGQ